MKKLSCFISSTFNDMQTERDFIRLTLEEKINDELRKAGLFLEFIDLRWGVNVQSEEESNYDKKVLGVCLEEIRNTKPFFIVFLGERYGWVPNEEDVLSILYENEGRKEEFLGKSITEIEINFALKTYIDTGKCLFYFRNPVDFRGDERAKEKFVSAGEDLIKLTELKQKITKLFPNQVRTYDASWDKGKGSFILAENFKEKILNDIATLFDDACSESMYTSEQQKRKALIDLTVEKKASLFAGRELELLQAIEFVRENEKKILDITSNEGCGKSVFMSKIFKEIEATNDAILYYFCDSVDEVFSLKELIKYFLQELGYNEDLSSLTLNELIRKFQQSINIAYRERQVVIFIDGIDRIIRNKKELSFLNSFAYNNVKFIISRNREYSLSKYISSLDSVELKLLNYTKKDISEVANRYFELAHRTVSESFIQELVEKEQCYPKTCSNPSYLNLLLQDINNLSESDFKKINENVSAGLSFSQNVEIFQKTIIKNAGKSFEEELRRQEEKIKRLIPLAKYYFEFLALSPQGMCEREMSFVLHKFLLQQSPTDFSLFVKSFKAFLVCDDNGYWHFSQRRILNYFLQNIKKEDRIKYYHVLLELYNEHGAQALKERYALSCYFELSDFEEAYNFLSSNIQNKIIIDAFIRYIDSSENYLKIFSNLILCDKSKVLERVFAKIIILHEIDFNKWYNIFIKFYNRKKLKNIISNKEIRWLVYNNLVSLSFLAYNKGEYVKGIKLVSIISKYFGSFKKTWLYNFYERKAFKLGEKGEEEKALNLLEKSEEMFKGYKGTNLFPAYELEALTIMLRAKLAKVIRYGRLIDLVVDEIHSLKKKEEQKEEYRDKEKRKIIKLLKSIDKIYQATEETKEREKISLNFIDDCIELGYFNSEERIYWLSKKFEYLSREFLLTAIEEEKAQSSWLYKALSKGSNKVLKDYSLELPKYEQEQKLILKRQYDEIVEYINNEDSNKELVALCCISLAKYHDNVAIIDDYTFTEKAVNVTNENLKNKFSPESIENYQKALYQKVCEREMLGNLRKEDAKELLKISKLSIQINPTTQNYDAYFEAYDKCERFKEVDSDDIIKKNEYIKKRKKEVKFEASEEKQIQKRKQRMFIVLESLFFILLGSVFLLILNRVAFFPQIAFLLVMSIFVGCLGSISIIYLFAPRNKKSMGMGILVLFLFIAFLIYLFNYSINLSTIYELFVGGNVDDLTAQIKYGSFIRYGGKELCELVFQCLMLLIPLVIALITNGHYLKTLRLHRSASDLKNYKTYVIDYPRNLAFMKNATMCALLSQIPIAYFLFNKYVYVINIENIERLRSIIGIRTDVLPMILGIIIGITVIVSIACLFAMRHAYKYLMIQKSKYDKRRIFRK